MTTGHEARELIDRLIAEHAATGQPFSANDLRGRLHGVNPRIIPPRFQAAAMRGDIERIGSVPSSKANTDRHHIALWRGTSAKAEAAPLPARDSLRRKADRLIRQGAVTVTGISAAVKTDTAVHRVTRTASGTWTCSGCPPEPGCSHVLAVALMTGGLR